jgi:hypothetical protein
MANENVGIARYGGTPTPIADSMERELLNAKLHDFLSDEGAPPKIKGFLTEEEQARKHGHCIATQRRWRRRGYGPSATPFGRNWVYREDGTERWLADQLARAEAVAEPRRRGRPRLRTSSS